MNTRRGMWLIHILVACCWYDLEKYIDTCKDWVILQRILIIFSLTLNFHNPWRGFLWIDSFWHNHGIWYYLHLKRLDLWKLIRSLENTMEDLMNIERLFFFSLFRLLQFKMKDKPVSKEKCLGISEDKSNHKLN